MRSILAEMVREKVAAWLMPSSEARSSLENPSTPLSYPAEWLLDIFNGGRTDSGLRVSEMTALQVSTCFACVQLISGAVGFLPLHIFERIMEPESDRPGKRIAYDHDNYDLLRYEPNPEMTSFTFRKTLQAHALLWGNCYAEIQRDQGNRIVALWPRNPAQTRLYRLTGPVMVKGEKLPAGALVYKTTDGLEEINPDPNTPKNPDAAERTVLAEDMVHLPGLALDARVGQSAVQLARQAVGLALATEKYGAKYFGNGARPGGVLTHPGHLKDNAIETLRRSWAEAQGGENAHRIAILEEGMKFEAMSNENEKAQFLQTREFQISEVCRVFSVPPHMIGETGKQNRANTEQIGLEFVTYTLGPWLEEWIQEIKRKLFPKIGRTAGRFFPKFETRALTMPDAESRRNFYATLRQWGLASADDIREMEDWNPLGGTVGTAILWPVNMQEAGTEPVEEEVPSPDEPQQPDQEPSPGGSPGEEEPQPGQKPPPPSGSNMIRAYLPIFRDAMRRILARRAPDSETFVRSFGPILASIADGFGHPEGFETSPAAAELLASMARRLGEWRSANGNFEEIARRELAAAIRAVALAAQPALVS